MSESIPLSALSLGNRAQRNRANHRTLPGTPFLRPGSLPDPEKVRAAMERQRLKLEEEEAAAVAAQSRPGAIQWDDGPKDWKVSFRRLDTYNADQQRALESRLYHGRNTHHKSDQQLSQELDLCPDDFDALRLAVQGRL